MFRFSKFGIIAALWFVVFQIIGRFLYPFGDEPDFTIRAPNLIFGDHHWLSPYSWLYEDLRNLSFRSACMVDASPFSLWAQIDSMTCSESFNQIIARLLITFAVTAPLIVLLCFNKFFIFSSRGRDSTYDGQRRDAFSLALLVPSISYSLGVLAEEQLVLALSLMLILVDQRWVLTFLLIAAISYLDFGNGLVVVTMILFLNFYRFLAKTFSIRAVFITALSKAVFGLFLGISFIDILSGVWFLSDKAGQIYSTVSASDLLEKYPVYLRPIITFMTAVFMTPTFIKVVPAFLLIGACVIVVGYRLRKIYGSLVGLKTGGRAARTEEVERISDCIAVMATIFLFVFLIPTYSNAKYYIFSIPFLLRGALLVSGRRPIRDVLIATQIIVFGGLFLYRI